MYFRKLYSTIKEGESVEYSVVAYKKTAVCFDVIDRGPNIEGRVQNVPVGWYHYLHIDCWIIIFDVRWESGQIRPHAYQLK